MVPPGGGENLSMKRPLLTVTDHAIVRYLERVGGFDVPGLRRQIAHRVREAADAGAANVTIDGVVFVFGENDHGKAVVTIMLRDEVTRARIGHGQRKREEGDA